MKLSNLYPIKSRALIYQGEIDYISKCILDYPNIETGGDLFGFWTHSGFPIIQYVIGPGKSSKHQVAFFNQDIDYLIDVGDRLRETHGLQHIGEWHSHHKLGLAEPSGHDITTVNKAIDEYGLSKFFLVIGNIQENSSSVNGFMFTREGRRNFDYAGWVVLNGESPIRQVFDSNHKELVYVPTTIKPSLLNLSLTTLNDTRYIKLEYSNDYWLSDKANHLVLKNIIDILGRKYSNIGVFQREDDRTIYMEFDFNSRKYNILFPLDFPNSSPIVKRMEGAEYIVDTAPLDWNNENVLNSILAFINNATEKDSQLYYK